MIASLMMYARPELEGEHTRLWACIRARLAEKGIGAPETLSQMADTFDVWEDPTLVLSQTCGMPYRTRLHPNVQLVGTPDYGLEGCAAGYYRSAIVVRADDPRETLAAFMDAQLTYNSANSQSGFASIYTHAKASGFWFSNTITSGGHLASAKLVAQGGADIAALDAQTWRLIQRYEPIAEQLRVLEYTTPTPGLPYITSKSHDSQLVSDAVTEALAQMPAADMAALDLRGLASIPQAAYMNVPTPPEQAAT